MEWIQFLIVVMTIGSFLWMARSDYRHLDAKMDAMMKGFREEMREISTEMKDFHGRLEKQDAEFKAFLRAEEQKRTQIWMNK